ncbi:MAG: hypothetical protein SP1CHLAM54_10020 [Chlamydiia bacterium]|nr:hypothetical protein [Chlamydiia bacterium]MCH9615908.1 hypothetical protein [Chlamydiia bacterium]MCH9628689.1 hypothetical protein [Chlamydiia bacterium]
MRIFAGLLFMCVSVFATHREMQFENEQFIVWKTTIDPGEPLMLHRHEHARIVVGIDGGELTKIEENGDTSPLVFETGKAYFLEADPEDELHGDLNETGKPIVVMVIQLKL